MEAKSPAVKEQEDALGWDLLLKGAASKQ